MERKIPVSRGIKSKETHDNAVIQSTHPNLPSTKNIALNRSITQGTPGLKTAKKPFYHKFKSDEVIHTNRSRKYARKRFKRNPQVPNGMRLVYVIYVRSCIEDTGPSASVLAQWKLLDEKAQALFHKSYWHLTSNQQTDVFNQLNEGESKTDWLHAKGMKVKREEVMQHNDYIH